MRQGLRVLELPISDSFIRELAKLDDHDFLTTITNNNQQQPQTTTNNNNTRQLTSTAQLF